ncbi:hypothetical protein [Shimia biformata]|uniref:hypothetical protein n=1 Tax=Shimia biformata TaxID=1294299 RepID=UPI001951491C|nr:hypothetical protein [Shimia biformata]
MVLAFLHPSDKGAAPGRPGGAVLTVTARVASLFGRDGQLVASSGELTPKGRVVLSRLLAAELGRSLPSDPEERAEALEVATKALEREIAQLPVRTRKETTDLLAALSFRPTRALVTGRWRNAISASEGETRAVLSRLGRSGLAFRRRARVMLHGLATSCAMTLPANWSLPDRTAEFTAAAPAKP